MNKKDKKFMKELFGTLLDNHKDVEFNFKSDFPKIDFDNDGQLEAYQKMTTGKGILTFELTNEDVDKLFSLMEKNKKFINYKE